MHRIKAVNRMKAAIFVMAVRSMALVQASNMLHLEALLHGSEKFHNNLEQNTR